MTPVPMAWRLLAPAPVEIAKGNTPPTNAIEVIRMGRKRSRQASSVASTNSLPCDCSSRANSMIRMAFLAESPMMAISPTLKYTSLGSPRSVTASTAPSIPSGTTRSTATGMDQLS